MFITCGYVDFDRVTSNFFAFMHVPLGTGLKLIKPHIEIVGLLIS